MTENEIATAVVDVAYHLHSRLGPGIFEVVYEITMEHELRKRGLNVRRQVPIPIVWSGLTFDFGDQFIKNGIKRVANNLPDAD